MRPWAKCVQWAQQLAAFDDLEMEFAYQNHRQAHLLQICRLCCVLQFLLFLALFIARATKCKLWTNPISLIFVEELLPLVIIMLLALATNVVRGWEAYFKPLLCASALCLIAIVIWEAHDMVGLEILLSKRDTLVNVWAELQSNGTLVKELEVYIHQQASRKHLTIASVQLLLLFDMLQFIGINAYFACTYLSIPVAVALLANLSPQVDPYIPEVYIFVVAISLYALCAGTYMWILQRHQFKANFILQRTQTLALEAQFLHDQMQRERALKEASDKADSMLNHILKNIMADASGCIYLFLEQYSPPDPWQLHQARTCLARGMSWCRRRQAVLQMVSSRYTPTLVATDLRTFVVDVVQGRDVVCNIADEIVLLDPLVCEIVLDNAVSNAVHHGDRERPVTLTISLQPPIDATQRNSCQVDFEVSNYVQPGDRVLIDDCIHHVLAGQEPGAMEPLGLREMFLAAQSHGMVVSLEQKGDLVVLRATLEAALLGSSTDSDSAREQDIPPLPEGIKIFCVDDSEVARRVLLHTFMKQVPGAVVRVFGETRAEVDQFMSEALVEADIVVMDNHLGYGTVQYIGTHLLRDLLREGFRGLACIRSANVSENDLAMYVKCGAHCILGKDVSPTVMVQEISAAYAEQIAGHGRGDGSPSGLSLLLGGTSEVDDGSVV